MEQVQSPEKRPAQRTRATALLVLGMHRSGTSAVTRVCSLLGARLGSDLLPPAADNVAGFWEQREIQHIHDELLKEFGSSWFDHRPMPAGWFSTARAGHYRERVLEVLRRDFTGVPVWAVKDPRMCRLVPFWLPTIKAMGTEPSFLLVARNPLEVALSLEQRDKFTPVQGLLIWLRHVLDAERDSRGFSRAFITYDTLLADWRQAVGRLSKQLGIDVAAEVTRQAAEIDRYLSLSHRHQQVDDKELAAHPLVTGWARETYEAFRHMCATPNEKWCHEFDRIAREVTKAEQLYGHWLTHERSEVVARGVRIDGLATELRAVRNDLAEHQSRVNLLGRELDAVRAAMAQRETRLNELTADLRTARVEIGERDARLEVAARELAERRRELTIKETRIEELSGEARNVQAKLTAARDELARREARVGELARELEGAQAESAQRAEHLTGLTGELTAARDELARREARVGELARELEGAQAESAQRAEHLTGLTGELTAAHGELARCAAQVEELTGEIAAREARVAQLTTEISVLRKSWSWRCTLPLRATRRAVIQSWGRPFHYCIDEPRIGGVVGGDFMLSGWCFALQGGGVKSVRARAGGKLFRGAYGLSRNDVAVAHPDAAGAERSGFQIGLRLHSGQHTVVLEALDYLGGWRRVAIRRVTVSPLRANFLLPTKWKQRAGNITFSGWCFHQEQQIQELMLGIGGQSLLCVYGYEHSDWQDVPEFPVEGKVGFLVTAFVPEGEHAVALRATLADGQVLVAPMSEKFVAEPTLRVPTTLPPSAQASDRRTNHPRVMSQQPGGANLQTDKQWCVFSHFSPFNTIDEHAQLLLQNAHRCGWNIVFVSSCPSLAEVELDKIRDAVHHVLLSNNAGRDWGNYSLALKFLGERAHGAHLLAFNDSAYGPLFDLEELFQAYYLSGADLYGVTDSYERSYHIQSYFFICGPRLTSSPVFQGFWKDYTPGRTKEEVIDNHEVRFSTLAAQAGLRLAAYCPYTRVRQIALAREGSYWQHQAVLHPQLNPTHFWWDLLIKEFRCPMLKVELLQSNPSRIPNLETVPMVLQQHTKFSYQVVTRHLRKLQGPHHAQVSR